MKTLWARVRARWRVLFRSHQLDADMQEEMRFHLEMECKRLLREQNLDRREAWRRAHLAFGAIEKYKEEAREARGLKWLDAFSLDCRLGARMLVKYPWLTVVGTFAITIVIAIGAISFQAITAVLYSTLPIKEGERVVSIQYSTGSPGNPERRVLRDFIAWREQIVSVEQLSAFRTVEQNLMTPNGIPESIKVAEMTASGFRVTQTAPLLGRYLIPSDEREDAPAVVVVGYAVWRSRFGGDPGIVGRTIKLGEIPCVIVGVMPEGFEFPVNHQFWTALRINPLDYGRLEGPRLYVFGSLAPGVTMERAQAELTTIGQRTAVAYPEIYKRLHLVILPYTREHVEIDDPVIAWALWTVQLLLTGLLLVVSVNVAILVHARTIARLSEIAVRSALGASRRRILVQLFAEALALSAVGTVAGLALAWFGLRWIQSWITSVETVPYWVDLDLSFSTVLYAVGLTVLAAAVIGVVPGLKATGRLLHSNLRESVGGSGARLGRAWTLLIVAQVAVAAAILPVAIFTVWEVMRMEVSGPGFPANEFLVAQVRLDRAASIRQVELMSRLEAERGVSGVTFSASIPGYEPGYRIELDGRASRPGSGSQEANLNRVDPRMFDVYGAKILTGRGFTDHLHGSTDCVVVNRAFVRQFLRDAPSLGRRLRYASSQPRQPESEGPARWYEIVGVVSDFPSFSFAPGAGARPTVYHPASPGEENPVFVSMRFQGGIPKDFIARFSQIVAGVDPALQVRNATVLADFYDRNRAVWRFVSWALALVTSSVLLLSAAGIYALMSFTVAQRTREIGIRAALGAPPRLLLAGIFGRAIRQLVVGVLVGSLLSGASLSAAGLSLGRAATLLLAVVAIILLVGLFASFGPARRGLRAQTTDALRANT